METTPPLPLRRTCGRVLVQYRVTFRANGREEYGRAFTDEVVAITVVADHPPLVTCGKGVMAVRGDAGYLRIGRRWYMLDMAAQQFRLTVDDAADGNRAILSFGVPGNMTVFGEFAVLPSFRPDAPIVLKSDVGKGKSNGHVRPGVLLARRPPGVDTRLLLDCQPISMRLQIRQFQRDP